MILINVFANIILLILTTCLYFCKLENLYFYKTILTTYSIAYYTLDTINEVVFNKSYLYIPHHIITIALLCMLQFIVVPINIFFSCVIFYFLIEWTSLIINTRYYIKSIGKLTYKKDLYFFLQYLVIRGIMFPYYIVYYVNPFFNTIITTILIIIYFMSLVWIFRWSSKLFFDYRKQISN